MSQKRLGFQPLACKRHAPTRTQPRFWAHRCRYPCCLFSGLIGQIFLSRSLLSTDYGLLIILLDALPPFSSWWMQACQLFAQQRWTQSTGEWLGKVAHRILKLQAVIALPFIAIVFIGSTVIWGAPLVYLAYKNHFDARR